MAFLHGATKSKSGGQGALKKRSLTPYLLLAPGLIWLITFFVIPIFSLASTSTMVRPQGAQIGTYVQELRFANYVDAFLANQEQYVRSFLYAGIATILALAISYPLAYMIAFKAGKYRNILLVLVVAHFFTSFLLRTVAWSQILGDEGPVLSVLRLLPFVDESLRLTATPFAVVSGLTYNFLPFMILPLYTSLEKIDPRLIEAAGDLYSPPSQRFWKVVWPLSLPGVISGTLLTFIPASGDYINAELLGSIKDKMIGNVIQSQFIDLRDYPTASSLSFTFMAIILVMIYLYIRKAGTDDLV